MRVIVNTVTALLAILMVLGCIQRKPERLARRDSPVSAELASMVADHERMKSVPNPDYEFLEQMETRQRKRVLELASKALIREPEDLYRAALILHRAQGESAAEVCLLAHYMALESSRKGFEPAKYLSAVALDRYLIFDGSPQRFGTQSFIDSSGHFRLYPYSTSTSDSVRAEWDVPPLERLKQGPVELELPAHLNSTE